jgi:hypothetical protein
MSGIPPGGPSPPGMSPPGGSSAKAGAHGAVENTSIAASRNATGLDKGLSIRFFIADSSSNFDIKIVKIGDLDCKLFCLKSDAEQTSDNEAESSYIINFRKR